MTTIIDAFAKLTLRQALLSPQDNEPQPQYVAARRRHKSGRKGRISVYRVVDDHIDDRGRRVRRYANVERDDLDDDERESFIGTEKRNSIKRGQSVSQRKNRTLHTPYEERQGKIYTPQEDEPQAKRPLIRSIKKVEVSRGRWLEGGNTRQAAAKARAQAKARRSRPDENHGTSPPDHRQQCQEASDSGISSNDGVTYNIAGLATIETLDESEFMCSGALPAPNRRSQSSSARASRPARPEKAAADYKTIKAIEEAGAIQEKYEASDPSEVLSSSFRQPLLSPHESKRLVFGAHSKGGSRSLPDQDIQFNMRTIEQQLAEEQQPDLSSPSTIEEPEAPQPLSCQSSVTPDQQPDEDEDISPFMNPACTPSRPPTSKPRRNHAVDASTPLRKIRQPTCSPLHTAGASVGHDTASEGLPGTSSRRGVPGFSDVRGRFLDHLQGMNPPGTPPYTPAGAIPFQQHETPKPELEEA
jgi:hypothetical protein